MRKLLSFISFLILIQFNVQSQSTFEHIHNLLITNCSSAGCHGNNSLNGGFDFTLSISEVYAQIVGAEPVNTIAKNKGDQLIFPGYPERSFLLRKISHGLSHNLELDQDEGSYMPYSFGSLPKHEIETVRQWILKGAPLNGDVVDRDILEEYYTNGGLEISHIPDPPDPSKGFQVQVGPIFLYPLDEFEFLKKQHIANAESIEINGIDVFMNWQSHHYIIYKFQSKNIAQQAQEGIRPVTSVTSLGSGKDFVSAWQFSDDIKLPETTAYFWEDDAYLDLNYHIKNYDTEKILKAEVFMNIYTQPSGTAEHEMHAELINYNYVKQGAQFFIPGGQTKTFTDGFFQQNSNDSLYIWMLTSHTHKFGTAYNIYERNPDGSKGEKLYNGHYNTSYEFDQGYYDFEHPAIRYFNPQHNIAFENGLIQEATFHNTSNETVSFGLTTEDEMMLFIVQYTFEKPEVSDTTTTSVYGATHNKSNQFSLLSNPVQQDLNIVAENLPAGDISMEIFNNLGQLVFSKTLKPQNHYNIQLNESMLSSGSYIIRLISGNTSETIPFIKL